jgi:IclR family KDG regulon transcriptional repressor
MLHWMKLGVHMAKVGEGSAPSRTLGRGLALLEGVARTPKGAAVTELAAAAGIDKGTASRLLSTLRQLGYVRQNPRDRRYLLAGKVLMLARGFDQQLNLVEIARPVLRRLQEETSQTIYLAVREGDHVVYVDQYDPNTDIRLALAIGRSLPLHVTAMGRAILAALPREDCERLLESLLAATDAASFPVDITHARDEINHARDAGWATVDRYDDVTRIGAAIVDAGGEPVGAVSVAGPSFQMLSHIDRFSAQCTSAAREISLLLSK